MADEFVGKAQPVGIQHAVFVQDDGVFKPAAERKLERLVEMYPHIGRERLQGALDYYAAYPDRVDEDIERNARALAEHEGRLWPA